jgi:DeoR/GlpR family transcriptional regulator of sugar metabolism
MCRDRMIPMAHNPRHDEILALLKKYRQLSVTEFTTRLGVSKVTIRKDLTTLEEKGYVMRTHGGAILAENLNLLPGLSARRGERKGAKRAIAARAAELVREGDTVFVDAGSTGALMAALLVGSSVRVVTNSLEVMRVLSADPEITLVGLGGNFRQEAGSFIGPVTVEAIRHFEFDLAFLGSTGFSSRGTFSCQNIIESDVKKAAIAAAKRRVVLADSSKFEASAFSVFARPEDIDLLVTDSELPDAASLQAAGLDIISVEVEP